MKKQLLVVAGAVLAASLTIAPLAIAQTTPPVVPTCSQAIAVQAELQKMFNDATAADKAVADAQKLYDTLDAARVEEAAAIKADNATVPPLGVDSQRTKDAKAAVVAAKAAVLAFEAKGVTIETLRKNAADTDAAAIKVKLDAAAAVTDKACRGADGVVTTTPSVPVVTYADCAAVRAAGKAPLLASQPGYRTGLDSDSDGVACEVVEGTSTAIPNSINTGRA